MRREWNHNTHFHRRLLRALPPRVSNALDIGCGDGTFAAALSARATRVVAVEQDHAEAERARRTCAGLGNVEVLEGDFLAASFDGQQFDAVSALASLHHMDLDAASARIRELLAPGGTFVALEVWTDRQTFGDLAWNLSSTAWNLTLRAWRGADAMHSPTAHRTTSLPETRAQLQEAFPGATIRRHLLWRYTLVWRKP